MILSVLSLEFYRIARIYHFFQIFLQTIKIIFALLLEIKI